MLQGVMVPGGVQIHHSFRQPRLVWVAPHQGWTRPDWRCDHATWSLIDLWVTFPRYSQKDWPTFLGTISWSGWINVAGIFSIRWKSGSTFTALRTSQLSRLVRSVARWTLCESHISVVCSWDITLSVIILDS